MIDRVKINCLSVSLLIVFACLIVMIPHGNAINCYTCSSWNWSDPDCHDPYNPANSVYTKDCMVPKNGHIGKFPAYFCLKIIGRKESTGEALVIRACILENMDNQCGVFRFQDDYFTGCILTCAYNGCNKAADYQRPDSTNFLTATVSIAAILLSAIINSR